MFDITIAGEINLDLILYGLPQQMEVERELLADDFRLTLGSSSAILAHNMAALGSRVGFITMTGDDSLGPIAMERLREAGVDVSKSVASRKGAQTGVTILLHYGAKRHILTYPGAMAEMSVDDLDFEFLASGRHFHLSSIFLQKGMQPGMPALLRKLALRGVTLSLDTNDDPEDKWGDPLDQLLGVVNVFLPNHREAMRIAGAADLDTAIQKLSKRVPVLVVKCGKAASVVVSQGRRWDVPALSVQPVDTIGAGDSFNAGFLKGYVEGRPLAECAAMGNATAALSTLRPGGTEAFRDAELMRSFLASTPAALHG